MVKTKATQKDMNKKVLNSKLKAKKPIKTNKPTASDSKLLKVTQKSQQVKLGVDTKAKVVSVKQKEVPAPIEKSKVFAKKSLVKNKRPLFSQDKSLALAKKGKEVNELDLKKGNSNMFRRIAVSNFMTRTRGRTPIL